MLRFPFETKGRDYWIDLFNKNAINPYMVNFRNNKFKTVYRFAFANLLIADSFLMIQHHTLGF
jgi:hypothetical protein